MTTKRTITLTDRPPVKITDEDWPTIAVASYEDYDGEFRSQANRTTDIFIRVRQRADDQRTIVYGNYKYITAWQGERDIIEKAGVLLPAGSDMGDIVNAIREVANSLCEQVGTDESHIGEVMRECIADLPAEEI